MDVILDRLRRLLALGTSANPHEAAAAAARAQALIQRHRLEGWLDDEAASVADPIEDARDAPIATAKRVRTWKRVLASAVAEVNGCVAYVAEGVGVETIVLVGRAADRAAVAVLYADLERRIGWLSATEGAGRDRRWHEDFRIGVVDAIAARLRSVGAEVDAELDGAALAVVGSASAAHAERLDRFVAAHLRLGKGRALRVDPRAWSRGRAAGEKLPLPRDGRG